MRLRRLGSAGVQVSEFALGTMTFGAEADRSTSHAILDAFVEAGGNLIDTADVYGPATSEDFVGSWLEARPDVAERMIVATKARFPMSGDPNDKGASRRHLRRALDASRRRLRRDTIELYQVHAWDPTSPVDETLRTLDDFVRSGAIDYFGFSNVTGWQLQKIVACAERMGTSLPVTLQPQYSLLVRETEYEIIPSALDVGVGILPWGPLGGGWLTGKYTRDRPPVGSTRLGDNPERGFEAYRKRAAQERTWRILEQVTTIAESHDVAPSRVALAWLLARPGVSSVILGGRTTEQILDNLAAAELQLTQEEVHQLDAVSDPLPADYPYGERGREQRAR